MPGWRQRLPLIVVALLAGCDPGWHYRVAGGKPIQENGLRYDVTGPDDTALRVYSSLFTSTLTIEVRITNTGTTPLTVQPSAVHVLTRFGRPLPLRSPVSEYEVVLEPGKSTSINARFDEQPDKVELQTVTWLHGGVRRNGHAVPLSVKLVAD